jgi:hypothetical protein
MTEQMIISHPRVTSDIKITSRKFVLEIKDFKKSLRNEERSSVKGSQEITVGDARFKFEIDNSLSDIWVSLRNLTDGNQTISATVKPLVVSLTGRKRS